MLVVKPSSIAVEAADTLMETGAGEPEQPEMAPHEAAISTKARKKLIPEGNSPVLKIFRGFIFLYGEFGAQFAQRVALACML
jgi:hypothetical protein